MSGFVSWKRFGMRLRNKVTKTGMSYRDLASDLGGISAPTLNRICHGKPCSVKMYLFLCEEFDIDPTWAYYHAR